jgi:serine/threonine protein kinase
MTRSTHPTHFLPSLSHKQAPEVLRCPPKLFPEENKHTRSLAYGCGADVWSVGVLAYELVMGCTPFPPTQQLTTAARLREAPPKLPVGIPY